jgi:hypothetical protein
MILDLDSIIYKQYKELIEQENIENSQEEVINFSNRKKIDVKYEDYAINYILDKKVYTLNRWYSHLHEKPQTQKSLYFTRKKYVFEFELLEKQRKRHGTEVN